MFMFISSFFSWWYTRGWSQVVNSFSGRTKSILNYFSVNQLLNTLFAPWRRIISYSGANIGDRFRAALDNLFSAAFIATILVAVFTIIEIIMWPLLPFSFVILIILGVVT